MIRVQIQGVKETLSRFELIDRSQIPWSLTLSLTRTAQKAKSEIQRGLPIRFTIRHLDFMQKGVRIQAATKSNQQAVVEDIHPFMALQEEGGQKIPYGRYLCVPLKGARPNPKSVIKPENTPRSLMESGVGFIRGNLMYRRGQHYKRSRKYMRIAGPGAVMSGVARDKITAMYALVPRAKIPKRYGFVETVSRVVQTVWPSVFEQVFEQQVNWHKSGER